MVKKSIPKSQVKILVETEFIQERSNIEENQYFFSYTVTIKNQGLQSVQLISRHWIINNALNEKFEVEGEGVIGEQPIIQPGDEFTYTSGTEIDTPVGNMKGSYHMITKEGLKFDAEISEFELNMPRTLH
jgi:ApaG protein|tara:strand:- start:187 stop:576 length:390 start_codon:yes stop_codon:yes gene_type:complete